MLHMKAIKKIAIIGVGQMGQAIATGLTKSGNFTENDLILSKSEETNKQAVRDAEIIILAVKPEIVPVVLKNIRSEMTDDKILMSVAARIKLNFVQSILGDYPIVRVMPNICAAVNESMSCWVKSEDVNALQIEKVKYLLNSLGSEALIENEELLDYITVIAGSGPAYFLYLAELFHDFAKEMNLEENFAENLIKQTFLGSASLLYESNTTAASLRQRVTSKGGTTEAGFKILEEGNFRKIFLDALRQAYERAKNVK